MKMPVTYFLRNKLLATGPHFGWDDATPCHHSVAFFCPACGELWGRVQVSGKPWHPACIPCAQHGGGSFIFSWRRRFDELPPAVLSYELSLLLKDENGKAPYTS